MRNEAMEAARYLLDLINNQQIQDEEQFYKSLYLLTQDPTFDPIKNDIIESENLRIIQNDTLIRALSMWSTDVYQVQEIELQYQKIRTEIIIPCYNRLGITRNVQHYLWKDGYTPTYALDKTKENKLFIGQTKKQLNTQKILGDIELEGVISIIISYHNIANIQSLTLSERIKIILGLLDRDIDPDKSE